MDSIKDRCPYISTRGDAEESVDLCQLNDYTICELMSQDTCITWEGIKKGEEL